MRVGKRLVLMKDDNIDQDTDNLTDRQKDKHQQTDRCLEKETDIN